MIEIKVPKDIQEFEPTLIGPFTARHLVCAIAIAILTYGGYLAEKALGIEDPINAPFFCLLAIPPALIGWVRIYGMHFEKFAGKAFRENFKPATKLWLILLAVGSFLAVDGFVLRRMWSENIFWTLLTATLIGAAVLYGIVLLYAFPLLARFENTTFGILKTAFLVGVRYLFCTLLMAAIYGIMGYVIVFVFTPAFLLGMGFCAMLCSFLMLRILYLIGGDPDAVHEEYDHDKN